MLGSLRREEDDARRFALSLAAAHAAGAAVEWEAFFAPAAPRRVALPTYPFQRERFWLAPSLGAGDPTAIGLTYAEHPLLGAVVEDPLGEGLVITGALSLTTHPWLAEHAVFETPILPGTAFLEIALAAAERCGAEAVAELTLQAPLALPAQGAVDLQVSVSGPGEQGGRQISIHSRPRRGGGEEEPGEWTTHATGTLAPDAPPPAEPLAEWPPPGATPIATEGLYERLAEIGLGYGPAFQGLSAAWRSGRRSTPRSPSPPSSKSRQGATRSTPHCWTPPCTRACSAASIRQSPRSPCPSHGARSHSAPPAPGPCG